MSDTKTRSAAQAPSPPSRISTGIAGLDDILGGGLAPNRLYLIEGIPGSGKTTLALQFLAAGRASGERSLYVTLSETEEELESVVASHGLTLDGVDVFDLAVAGVGNGRGFGHRHGAASAS